MYEKTRRKNTMKLAEALIERADMQKKLASIQTRICQNAKTQEGEEPAEIVSELIDEFNKANQHLEALIKRINKTNSNTIFKTGTLIDAIVERNRLAAQIKMYRDLYESASNTQMRFVRLEIVYKRCIDISSVQKKIDELAKEHRTLDIALQEANWHTELLT